MNDDERKLMLKIAKELDLVKKDVELLKKGGTVKNVSESPVEDIGKKADKFFNHGFVHEDKKGPNCTVQTFFKDLESMPDKTRMEEIKRGQELMRKAIEEFCQEFDIKEFRVLYTDNTPKK